MKWVSELPYEKHEVTVLELKIEKDGKASGSFQWLTNLMITGKTFAAACIANALTEQGVPVLMTNFSKILNSLSGMFSEDRNKYLASFGEFDLLIIDDLGIERTSEYAQEQVYNVVDRRYLSRLPFIITTNLTLAKLKDPKDIAHACIYDHILERCAPVCFSGRNYRTENAENTKNAIREIFTEEDSL